MKDAGQKLKAVRYCVAIGLVPQLEVVVRHDSDTSDRPTDITDVDVLGVRPAGDAPSVKVLFDCKTVNKMSPVNRALWANGLMSLVGASEAFVILTKPAPEGHRLAANTLDVRLFSEKLFDEFAGSTAKDYLVPNSYLESATAWEALARIGADYPALREYLSYLSSAALTPTNAAIGLRALMGRLKRIQGELDPRKAGQRMVFLWTLSQLLYFLSDMAREFHSVFDPDMGEDQFAKSLRYYVWGGRESYLLRKRLSEAIQRSRGEENGEAFELPAWNRFIETFRSLLDAPLLVGSACLPVKDLAFRELSTPVEAVDIRLAKRIEANNRVRQFAMLGAAYLIEAASLPREFGTELERLLTTLKS